MATRGRTTFQKRQKELARKEKQQMKAERRKQKKLSQGNVGKEESWDVGTPSEGEPESESRAV